MAETIGSFAALGDSFTEGLNDPRPGGGFLGWAEVLGVPVQGDWRAPLPSAVRQPWLTARREDARWAREYALPWVNRRLRHISSGDGLPPKRPQLLPVR